MAVQQFSITLSEVMAQTINTRVERGEYASASEVIREAMRVWMQREKRLAELDAAIAVGLAQADAGQFLDIAQIRERLKNAG